MGDLMPWGLPPFSVTFATLITADIMVLMEDRSEPSKPMGEFDVIGTGFYTTKKSLLQNWKTDTTDVLRWA